MAIIVDPDNLDRNQVIFGTEVSISGSKVQQTSLRDVGTVVSSVLSLRTDGRTASGSWGFTGSSAEFVTWGVTAGQALCIFTKGDAGHFLIQSVDSATTLTISQSYHTRFSGSGNNLVYSIHHVTGGSIVDGVTEQAVYSFAKEEWRTDTSVFGGDNLIRHPFLFEAITREQMEIGGGTAHDVWDYNTRDNNYTKKKIRTGGWAHVNAAATTLNQYSGIITLGSIDTDAQVYFQQSGTLAAPSNFTFEGPVNEAILVNTSGSSDLRSYLKLFVRKKYRTYGQSEISDIGVTTLETIVNRFPLQHTTDAAITDTEAAIVGSSPFRNQRILVNRTDGSKGTGSIIFAASGANFFSAGVSGSDTLTIGSGDESGSYFTINTYQSTSLTCSTDVDFTGFLTNANTLTFQVTTTDIIRTRTDGTIVTASSGRGTITGSSGHFISASAGDMLIITESPSAYQGVYKIVSSALDGNHMLVDTSDQSFPDASVANIDYKLVEPGMYLQFKEETLTLAGGGTWTFQATPPAITRSLGSWTTDGVNSGSILTVLGSTSNNGSFTVYTVDNATRVTLVPTDTVVVEGPVTVTSGAYNAFKRVVNGVTYGFHWRLFGNDASLADCYQFVQHQLRQPTDIDYGPGTNNPTNRGDVTDLLMSFASPTGTTFDLYIDDLAATDTNNVTYTDATGNTRLEKFLAVGAINFNTNLQNDADAVYAMFFTNDNAGDNTGRDYGTPSAILVQDADGIGISGSISAQASVTFTFDYDTNVQRGAASAGVDAPVTIVAIGLNTAQFVLAQGTIGRSKANNFSLVSALERNYNT